MFDPSILYGIIAMLGFGLGSAFSKKPAEELGSLNYVLQRGIFLIFLYLIPLYFFRDSIVLDPQGLLIISGISVIGYIGLAAFYKSLAVGKLGINVPMANTSGVYSVLLSLFFLNESLSQTQIIALPLIFVGVILISLNLRDLRNSDLLDLKSGIPFSFLTSICWGFAFFFQKYSILLIGFVMNAFMIELLQTIFSFIHLKSMKSNVKSLDFNNKTTKYTFTVAVLVMIAMLGYSIGAAVGQLSIVVALQSANPLVATLYGIIFKGERLSTQQVVSSLLIVFGIILISI